MKKLIMFHFVACPYCREAMKQIDAVKRENPELRDVEIEKIDEKLHPEIADAYDYWYVPTFYLNGKKLHEGACDPETVRRVLRAAMEV